MIRINLLPVRASRKQIAGRQQLTALAAAVIVVLIANIAWSRSRAAALSAAEAKLKGTRSEIAQLERIIGEVKSIKAQQAAVKDKLAVLDRLKAGRQGPVRMMDDLSVIIPKNVWLNKFDEKGGIATLQGSAGSIEDVSAFLTVLKKSQYFTNVELKKASAKTDKKAKIVDFTMVMNVNYTPGVQVASAAPAAVQPKQR